MIYTRKTLSVLLMSVALLIFGILVYKESLNPLIDGLKLGKNFSEIYTLSLIFALTGFLYCAYAFLLPRTPGTIDYYIGAIPGILFIMVLAMLVKWFGAPLIKQLSTFVGDEYGVKFGDAYYHKLFAINHVTIGILVGLIVANVLKIPTWAEHGVRFSRVVLKIGVILLGTQYSIATITKNAFAAFFIVFFVLGTVILVLWLGSRWRTSHSMSGVLSSGMGVCGVSATIAAAPVVQAKSTEIAYTIATILLWGVLCMFLFPIIGQAVGLSAQQFGAWAGTGILNSAQVSAAAQAFDASFSNGELDATTKAFTFNITRVLILPLIVLILAVWYVQKDHSVDYSQMNMGEVVVDRFPIFVIGFLFMFALSSQGFFAPSNHYKGKFFTNNVAPEKLLTDAETDHLRGLLTANVLTAQRWKQAMDRLIQKRKIMSESDEHQLKQVQKFSKTDKTAKKILKKALKAVRQTSKKVAMLKRFIDWLFTFGLVGLGMQITLATIRQAGGTPMIIGAVLGTLKAGLSLVAILFIPKISS